MKKAVVRRVLGCALALLLPMSAAAEGRYIVKFKDANAGRAALTKAGGQILKELGPQNAAAARLPDEAVGALEKNPAIEYVEADPIRVPLAQTTPWGITQVQAKEAQSVYSVTGANRKVCIIDSGFYVGHEDLQAQGLAGYPSGWDTDRCGHGTHVAGTIAALNDGSMGVEGVLPNGASLFIVKVFGDDCSWTYASDLVDASNRCASAGAHVINMSLGGSFKSRIEQNAFDAHWNNGILSVAAAGNDGTNAHHYPASYTSVVSVGATDENQQIAAFSQYNSEVDLAAPGVAVLSTVPYVETNTLTVGSSTFNGTWIQFAARSSGRSGPLVDGGLCDSVGAWSGAVVLCQRGSISFFDKVRNVQQGGGTAAVIYNNAPGSFTGTLGDGNSSTIPAIGLSDTDGAAALALLGQSGTVVSQVTAPASGYEFFEGTSMASPHVAGVAALVWSYNTQWTNAQIRDALEQTAKDLGSAGRDDFFGHGLVQARAALDYLLGGGSGGGGGGGSAITLSTQGSKVKGTKTVELTWAGATTSQVDVYRNGTRILSGTANDGTHTDTLGKGGGSYTYRVCESASTTVCSNDSTVSF